MQSGITGSALAVVKDLDPNAAAVLLEEEIREAIVGTVGTAVGMCPHAPETCPESVS